MIRRFAVLLAIAGLVACSSEPQQANPALWRVEDGQGHAGWLFGTIHSAERPLAWRTAKVSSALDEAGSIMVEVGNLANEAEVAATFESLARSENEPPLSERVPPKDRAAPTRQIVGL